MVLTVCRHILKFPVGEQIKAHLLNILLPQFRKNMGDIGGKHTVGGKHKHIGGFQVLPVVIQQVGNPVQGHGSLSGARRPLDHQNPVPGIADDGVLLPLNGPDNIFQFHISARAQLLAQNLIIDFQIALKGIDQFAVSDLILPLGSHLPVHLSGRGLIGGRSPVIVIKQAADRRPPVIDQRSGSCPQGEIADADVEGFRFLIPFIEKIHPSEIRRVQHPLKLPSPLLILLVGIDLPQQCLLIVIIFVAVLVHLRIVVPVIFMHAGDILLSFADGIVQHADSFPDFIQDVLQKFFLPCIPFSRHCG